MNLALFWGWDTDHPQEISNCRIYLTSEVPGSRMKMSGKWELGVNLSFLNDELSVRIRV